MHSGSVLSRLAELSFLLSRTCHQIVNVHPIEIVEYKNLGFHSTRNRNKLFQPIEAIQLNPYYLTSLDLQNSTINVGCETFIG